jgi:Ser/Thr protein kinase RdoA (MazF antagonist)
MSISINDVRNLLTSAYVMGDVSGISRIDNGDWNSIYRVRSDKDWILRLSHDRETQAQLEFEIAIVSHLSTQLT